MQWIIEHWKLLAVSVAVLGVLIISVGTFCFSLKNAIPLPETLKQWSIQEAIFYGFCVLAFVTLLKG